MASLVRSVLSAKTLSNPSKLGQLSTAVQRSVTLDSDWDILQFATRLQDLAGGKVKFETIPAVDINATTDYGESIVQVDPAAVKKYVASLLGDGNSAEANAENSEAPAVDPSTVTVNVANDSGIEGLANGVAGSLTALGYVGGTIGNYEGSSISSSRIQAADVDSDAARRLGRARRTADHRGRHADVGHRSGGARRRLRGPRFRAGGNSRNHCTRVGYSDSRGARGSDRRGLHRPDVRQLTQASTDLCVDFDGAAHGAWNAACEQACRVVI